MTSKRSIHIPGFAHRAPIPAAAKIDQWLYSSAISGIDPASGKPAEGVDEQVQWVFRHLRSLLDAAAGNLGDVIKMAVRISDERVREPLNQAWLAAFPDPDDRPARHIEVSPLPAGLHLQIEVVAIIK